MHPAIRRTRRWLIIVGSLLAVASWGLFVYNAQRELEVARDTHAENEWVISPRDPAYLWKDRIIVCVQRCSRIQVYDLNGRLLLVRNPAAIKNFSVEFRDDKLITFAPSQREYRIYDSEFRLVGQEFESKRSPPLKPRSEGVVRLAVDWSMFGAKVKIPTDRGIVETTVQSHSWSQLPFVPQLFIFYWLAGILGICLLGAAAPITAALNRQKS